MKYICHFVVHLMMPDDLRVDNHNVDRPLGAHAVWLPIATVRTAKRVSFATRVLRSN